jgi:hypothetical protein
MRYKDVFIPLLIGLIFIFGRKKLVKSQDPAYLRKRRSLKIGGLILLLIAAIYTVIILKNNRCITC